MKNALIALVLFLTVASCLPKKKDDVAPAPPDLAGTYQVSQIISGATTVNLPDGNGASANAVVTRPNDTQIGVIVNVTENGTTDATNYGRLTTRKANGQEYDVLNPNTGARIGSINGTDFILDFTSNGQRFALISKK